MAFKMKNPSMAKMVKAAGNNRVAMKMKKESAMKLNMEKSKRSDLERESMAKLKEKASAMKMKKDSAMKKEGGKMTKHVKNPAYIEYEKKRKAHRDRGGSDESFTMTQPPKYVKASERKTGEDSPSKMKKSAMTMKKDSATKFNAKLKAASKAGKLSGEFKKAVDASPAKMKKSTMKLKKENIKKDLKGGREMLAAKKNPGKPKRVGTSVYEDKYEGTGDTRSTRKAEKKFAKAEKKLAKEKFKQAERKVKKGRKTVVSMPSGPTTRSRVQRS